MFELSAEALAIIKRYQMMRHPEGGYYAEFYRSSGTISGNELSSTHDGPRSFMTSIFFMLTSGEISRLHRLRSDEIWYFHCGASVTVHIITPGGRYKTKFLGSFSDSRACHQVVVKAGSWFGATIDSPDSVALVGCAVAPGFDFADFELADRTALAKQFPQHKAVIERLTADYT